MRYVTERVTLPVSDVRLWLTLDAETLDVVPEVRDWMLHLSAMDRSPDTLRAYGPRVTLFLNWADGFGCDWPSVTLPQMARFRHFVEATPSAHGRAKSPVTVNATLTAVVEFLRFCAHSGLIEPEVADRLSERRHISHTPDGDDGLGQYRSVRSRVLKVKEVEQAPSVIRPETIQQVLSQKLRPRDRFLVEVLLDTGLRVGECLGLRRSDVHFLPDSRALGCDIAGAHLHVVPRKNENNARAKGGRKSRHVPVSSRTVRCYAEYMAERADRLSEDDSDYVFVNLYSRDARGKPMTYSAVKQWFEKVSREIGEPFRPHMLRHTAATTWLHDAGAELDVVQALLGHSSAASTAIYLHPDEKTLREAVEAASLLREKDAR